MENPSVKPILIVDKRGVIGRELASHLSLSSLVIFVSSLNFDNENIIFTPFNKKIPKIPDNSFSQMIVIYEGEAQLRESLPSFIRKARETQAPLYFVTSIFHYRDSIAASLLSQYEHLRLIVLGDIFDKQHSFQSPVNKLLLEIEEQGGAELSHNGLNFLYPVSLSEATLGIISVISGLPQEGQVFAVMPSFPITELSFVRLIKKKHPLLKIDFIKNKQLIKCRLPDSAIPVLKESHLEKELGKMDITLPSLKKSSKQINTKSRPRSKEARKKSHHTIFYVLSLVFFLLALPFLLTFTTAVSGGVFLSNAKTQIEQGRLEDALRSASTASSLLKLSDQSATTLVAATSLVGLSGGMVYYQNYVHTGKAISDSAVELLSAGLQLRKAMGSSGFDGKQEFLLAIGNLKQAALSLQAIEAEGNLPEPYKSSFSAFEKPLGLLINLIDASPKLLGFDGEQQYLLLFQNNFELRPGGGFIGSYGILGVDHGKITKLQINDVYDADGRLKADLKPPFGLSRYMGAPHWFLRDSNFDPDFGKSASVAASFLKLETGEGVNGVIGLDVSFLSSILEATGPITIPDYKVQLTKDNFYLLTQKHAEGNFFPGSTQKRDFLRSVEQELVRRVEVGNLSYRKLVGVLTAAVEQKHLLFAFSDPGLQKLFAINNLSGSLSSKASEDPAVFSDSIGVSEANIGQNKSNYYLKRRIGQDIAIDGAGVVRGKITLTYTNQSTAQTPFGGEYKTYLRLIAPSGSVLNGVEVDQKAQKIVEAVTNPSEYLAASFRPPEGLEVDTKDEGDKTYFGLVLNIPQGKTRSVSFNYTLLNKVRVDLSKWTYALHIIKQQGTLKDFYTLTVRYPLAVRLFGSNPNVSDLGGKAIYEGTLDSDKDIQLTFVSK